jgi:hypothetical protein
MFDVKIYVHADSDERLIRRMKRDIAERGRIWTGLGYQNTLYEMTQWCRHIHEAVVVGVGWAIIKTIIYCNFITLQV